MCTYFGPLILSNTKQAKWVGASSTFWESCRKIWHAVCRLQHWRQGKRQFCAQFIVLHCICISFFFIVILRSNFSFHQEKDKAVVSSPLQKPCQLNSKVQSLLELICDLKAMEEYVLEMKFDTKKAPLGGCVCVCAHLCTKLMKIIQHILHDEDCKWKKWNNWF